MSERKILGAPESRGISGWGRASVWRKWWPPSIFGPNGGQQRRCWRRWDA